MAATHGFCVIFKNHPQIKLFIFVQQTVGKPLLAWAKVQNQ